MNRYTDPAIAWLMARGRLDPQPGQFDRELSHVVVIHEAAREAAQTGVSVVDRVRAAIAAFRAPRESMSVDCSDCIPA